MEYKCKISLIFYLHCLSLAHIIIIISSSSIESKALDFEALLNLKSSIDPYNTLHWHRDTANEFCTIWQGVKQCSFNGTRVTKLILEFYNLTGQLNSNLLSPFDQLRVLSFKSNALTGAIPDLSALTNLKTLYLNDNYFSGNIPATLAVLHRLKIIVMAGNLLSGPIPASLTGLPRLHALLLQDNRLTGPIPAFEQSNLVHFNISNNNLWGQIPTTQTLSKFNITSFLNNAGLCGAQIEIPCFQAPIFSPSPSPRSNLYSTNALTPLQSTTNNRKQNKKRLIIIIVTAIIGATLFSILCFVLTFLIRSRRKSRKIIEHRSTVTSSAGQKSVEEVAGAGYSWEQTEGSGKLVFFGGTAVAYGLEDLLKASAETLGRGTVGSTYKAVMEKGMVVAVKRLKDASSPSAEDFRRRMEELGRLRHPNLVSLRAFFEAKEERLMVYDYYANGSLFSLIHGSRPIGRGKPLHWTSCLKIAEDVAAGLLYLHQTQPRPTVHGNLKSSNVLLGPDFESCLSDYVLIPSLVSVEVLASASSTSLFYRAPECRNQNSYSFTTHSDVYSFGVLLLELLTGKTPFQDIVEQNGPDIPRWVRLVREQERKEAGEDHDSSGNEAAEDKLLALLNITMACVVEEAHKRPTMEVVARMIREAKSEVFGSSNSSIRSQGQWSDAVQSLPREQGSESFSDTDFKL